MDLINFNLIRNFDYDYCIVKIGVVNYIFNIMIMDNMIFVFIINMSCF